MTEILRISLKIEYVAVEQIFNLLLDTESNSNLAYTISERMARGLIEENAPNAKQGAGQERSG